jgi:MraZ protein
VTFYGTYGHTMDERGRLAVPANFRHAFVSGGVLRPTAEGCVELYDTAAFEAEVAKRLTGPDESTRSLDARRTRRGFLAGAQQVELDRQGRIQIAPLVRAAAGLEGRAVILGCGDYIEIWDEARWLVEQAAIAAAEAAR